MKTIFKFYGYFSKAQCLKLNIALASRNLWNRSFVRCMQHQACCKFHWREESFFT